LLPADLPAFLGGLLDFLTNAPPADWRALDWQNFLETSPTLSLLEAEAKQRGWTFTRQPTYHAPSIPLKGDFETYLCGIDKKQRHEIRRKMRRAMESGLNVHWYIVGTENASAGLDGISVRSEGARVGVDGVHLLDISLLDNEVEAFLALMAEDPEKAAFLTAPMREQMHLWCRQAFENGWLQLSFLEVDGQRAAGYLNFDYLNRIWVYNSGVGRRYMELSPGWVLLGHLLEWANDHQRSEFDFMRGEEDYKYRFGGVDKLVLRAKVVR